MENLSVLVTGGAGFIGSHIVETLLTQGVKKVRVLDNLSTGSMNNIQSLLDTHANLEYMYGDISNTETCSRAVKDMDVVCHQAALGSVPRSIDNPLVSHQSNVDGFIKMLVAANEAGIKRFVYASSSSVYGTNDQSIKIEDENGLTLSPYAATKYINEVYAGNFHRVYQMETIGLRYFNIFGPRQTPHGPYAAVIPRFMSAIAKSERPVINGDGSHSRDFTFVSNAVQANIKALTTTNASAFGQVFNIGCTNPIDLNTLFKTIAFAFGSDVEPIYGAVRPGDLPYSNASIQKARELLGYEPTVTFEEGILKTVEWFRDS